MLRKKIFAAFAFLTLAAFCFILLRFVPRLDLTVVLLIGLVLAAYDIWDELFRPRRPPSVGR
ncbi:hypothetical protein EET67_18405 [Pseudaminobacter arsenicus]|uniref:Phosphatidate cytidylyltransferase n=1 Tax=Borborobacter arsenicus TaxID=1851146 RepID=A0A432V2C8_9HYPH|nr:hypothetical protein [Pseudaminobacter arsenicus]RUM96321.1 hypothetical protein EET67_18405 [Pseudaminobacter arsenicus]